MFQIRKAPSIVPSYAPSTMACWGPLHATDDTPEQLRRLRRQLGSAISDAETSGRRVFLRALGRDIDEELRGLAGCAVFELGEEAAALAQRCRILEQQVWYYSDVVVSSKSPFDLIEVSDCAREAVAGLSGDMRLVLRIEGEPVVLASRRLLTALFEVAILAATGTPSDEVEVIVPRCAGAFAELRVVWPRGSTIKAAPVGRNHDHSRFLALAVAYALVIGGRLSRSSTSQEVLSVRIPIGGRFEHDSAPAPAFDTDVIAQATAFCAGYSA